MIDGWKIKGKDEDEAELIGSVMVIMFIRNLMHIDVI